MVSSQPTRIAHTAVKHSARRQLRPDRQGSTSAPVQRGNIVLDLL
jgi:hypothetical protein